MIVGSGWGTFFFDLLTSNLEEYDEISGNRTPMLKCETHKLAPSFGGKPPIVSISRRSGPLASRYYDASLRNSTDKASISAPKQTTVTFIRYVLKPIIFGV